MKMGKNLSHGDTEQESINGSIEWWRLRVEEGNT